MLSLIARYFAGCLAFVKSKIQKLSDASLVWKQTKKNWIVKLSTCALVIASHWFHIQLCANGWFKWNKSRRQTNLFMRLDNGIVHLIYAFWICVPIERTWFIMTNTRVIRCTMFFAHFGWLYYFPIFAVIIRVQVAHFLLWNKNKQIKI